MRKEMLLGEKFSHLHEEGEVVRREVLSSP
jgi:hypothetical protein